MTKGELLQLHDEIKNHPFWNDFDVSLFSEVFRMIRNLVSKAYQSNLITNRNPHAELINKTTHDFNAETVNYRDFLTNVETRGAYTLVLQTYLSNLHRVICDEIDAYPVQYLLYKKYEKPFKYVTTINADNITYRVLAAKSEEGAAKYLDACRVRIDKQKTFIELNGDVYGWRTREIEFFEEEVRLLESGEKTTQAIIIQ